MRVKEKEQMARRATTKLQKNRKKEKGKDKGIIQIIVETEE